MLGNLTHCTHPGKTEISSSQSSTASVDSQLQYVRYGLPSILKARSQSTSDHTPSPTLVPGTELTDVLGSTQGLLILRTLLNAAAEGQALPHDGEQIRKLLL